VADNDDAAKPSVALVSPCGYGNLGDAAIIDSVIAAVRSRLGDVAIAGFTMNPDDTAARHRIEAHSILGFSRPFYPVLGPGGARRGLGPRPNGHDWLARLAPLRKLRTLGALAAAEGAHEKDCRGRLAACKLIIVAGGGQLDEFWGGPLGQPFALWRWSSIARRVGARYVMLSVGTGKLVSRLGKRLARAALAGASYRSFRDEGSRGLIERPEKSPVVPDLAYAVPLPPVAAAPGRARKHIAVSPMSYRDPRNWPNKSPEAYQEHVRTMAAFVARLLAEGFDVSLFATDSSDWDTVADVRAKLAATETPGGPRAELVPTKDVAPLLAFLRGVDLVVACRLHAVLLSHVVGTPVVAVSYERKVVTVMRETGQGLYSLPIENFKIDDAVHTVRLALGERPMLARDIQKRVAEFKARVEQQYDEILTPAAPSA
jgi:polysaccharide pyruvyl transferase WcaK-like protein